MLFEFFLIISLIYLYYLKKKNVVRCKGVTATVIPKRKDPNMPIYKKTKKSWAFSYSMSQALSPSIFLLKSYAKTLSNLNAIDCCNYSLSSSCLVSPSILTAIATSTKLEDEVAKYLTAISTSIGQHQQLLKCFCFYATGIEIKNFDCTRI